MAADSTYQSNPLGVELPVLGPGRVHRSRRTVRLSDADPSGWSRLDAMARFLQDVATDDVRQAGIEESVAWVVRRTSIVVGRRPRYGEGLELATWCSGTGTMLAERRTTVTGDRGASAEAVSLWVSLDPATMRMAPVTEEAFALYREAAGSRRVRSRFILPGPPPDLEARSWSLRWSDFDLLGHVNNVVAWTAAEEEAHRLAPDLRFDWGQVEYRQPIEPGHAITVGGRQEPDFISVWLMTDDGSMAASARLGYGRSLEAP